MTSRERPGPSENQARPGATLYDASKQHVDGKFHTLSLESKFLETYLALEMSVSNAKTHGKLQRCQTLQSNMPITAETMQTNDL